MSKYVRRNCVVDAVLWTGGPDQLDDPEWLIDAIKNEYIRIYYQGTSNVRMNIKYDNYETVVYPGNYLVLEDGQIRVWDKERFEQVFEMQ